jgi:hypothetical protein
MIITAFRELVSRRTATALAAVGLLTATLGFMLLASTSKSTEAVLTGDLTAAWASPYDILVRPVGAALPLEQSSALVRPNFLSASPSGITLQQLDTIRAVPGVAVAAPIAVVGVTQVHAFATPAAVAVDLSQLMGDAAIAVFRITPTINADGGYSHYPIQQITIAVAPGGTYDLGKKTLTVGSQVIPCYKVLCFGGKAICPVSGLCPDQIVGDQQRAIGLPPGRPGATINFPFPLTIAGVDPVAEEELSGIAKCVTSGHYLQPGAGVGADGAVPILLSDRSLLDESISATIARTTDVTPVINGQDPAALTGWQSVGTQTIDPNQALQNALEASTFKWTNVSPIWMPGPVQYTQNSAGDLVPQIVPADPSAYSNPFVLNAAPDFYMPVEAGDVWFRNLQDRYQTGTGGPGNQWNVVGRFNPSCLPSFSGNGAGQMATFAQPVVKTADGTSIGPNRSLAGFLDSPPLILTTLQGAQYFADPTRFEGAPGPKFISAIRIKVAGTEELGKPSQERLSRVAAQIQQATGLQVDIVKGSSPRPLQIALPAGKFGRPALTVTQGWASKGVAFRLFDAVSFQNLAIFAIVLVGALILVAQTAYVSVRRRRSELAVLRALGWPPWRIALLVELEMLILGLTVGAAALGVGALIISTMHVGPSWWTLAGVVPLAVLIALAAGLLPALTAMRGAVLSVISSQEPVRERTLPSSPLALGLRQVIAWHWDVAAGVAALALGAALLGVIELIAAGFRGQLDATLLGTYLSGEVRPFHFVVAGLTLAIGAIAAAQVITLTYLERRAHLATLRALGWRRTDVLMMLLGQAMGLGVIAAAVAVVATVAIGLALSASPFVILGSAATAVLMTLVTTAIAVIAPLSHAYATDPAAGLRGE